MLNYLYQALNSKWGICLSLSNVGLGKARLYQARAKAADPALSILQIRPDPHAPNERLWIIKGAPTDGTPSQ